MIKRIFYCDFCGKSEKEVDKIIAGPKDESLGNFAICDECVGICVDILEEDRTGEDLEALRLDAARYRALRDVPAQHGHQIHIRVVEEGLAGAATGLLADAAVDLLIAKAKEKANGL